MAPFQGGGEMIREVPPSRVVDAAFLGMGYPTSLRQAHQTFVGNRAKSSLKYLEAIGMENIFNHEKELTAYATQRMMQCEKVTIYGPRDLSKKCGIIPFSIKGLSSHDTALFFDNYGIMLRSGYHCAQPLHEIFKISSSARASFYLYNTKEEIDRFIDILGELDKL
jgi:cysteine desulfurase/selenocysteine lyase